MALLAQGRVDIAVLVSHELPIEKAKQRFTACLQRQAVKMLFALDR